MKTFTKTVSMILIAVMCLSLFASGAYAMDFDFSNGGTANAGASNGFNAESGFDFGNVGSSNSSVAKPDTFTLDTSNSSVTNTNTFDLVTNDNDEDKQDEEPQKDKEEVSDEPILFTKKGLNGNSNLKFAPGDTTEYDKTQFYTFNYSPSEVTKTEPKDIEITGSGNNGATFGGNTFATIQYTVDNNTPSGATAIPSKYLVKADDSVTILASFIEDHGPGTYYLWGVTSSGGSPCEMGGFYINPGTYAPAGIANSPYDLIAKGNAITATASSIALMKGFGVASTDGSFTDVLDEGIDYNVSGTTLTFTKSYLSSLSIGSYYLIGFPSYPKTNDQANLGKFAISSENTDGGYPGSWDLWPSYDIPWTSGDDPLMFRSNLMALRQTYPRYTIVPRYGYGAGSIPNNMIDVNQFWDMGDGVFALGTNFLRSLPAGTYTLQVVDYKHLNDCTNVVTFRIGSTLRPIDTDKHVIGSIKNLRFLCDEPVYEVYVGNIPLTYGEDYALSNGNKTITLSFEFLNKRSAGNTYTIKALTYSGTYPSTTVQSLSTAQGSASPRTGDESNLGLWAAFLLLSGTAIVVLVPKLRKHDF